MIEVDDKQIAEALDRIARTDDGELLYLFLQKVLCAVTLPTQEQIALLRNEGRRSLAAVLMGHMAEGLLTSGRTRNPVVVFTGPKRDAGSPGRFKPTPGGRRISADTRVYGYDLPDEPDPA